MEGFLRFADVFFDGLFADWAVMDQIGRSTSQVQDTLNQIEGVLSRLSAMSAAAEKEQAEVNGKLNELVVETRI